MAASAADRRKSGGGKGMREGSFPVETHQQRMSAVDLRGHAPDPSAVLDKVSRKANATGDTAAKAKVAKARAKERKR